MNRIRIFVYFLFSIFSIAAADAQMTGRSTVILPSDTIRPKAADTTIGSTPIDNAVRALIKDSARVSFGDSVMKEVKTLPPAKPISFRSIVVPAAMISYGVFTFAVKDLKKLNISVRTGFEEIRKDSRFHIDNFTLVSPAVAVYALNLAGVKGKHNLVDRSMLYGLSNLIGQGLIVNNVKRLANVMRPDSSNRLSFPSGHTAEAFIAAEFLRQEYMHISPWYGVAGYAVAAGTGFLRMYNNKHWLNDVIAGAGVGLLSTRVTYWLYPKLKKAFAHTFRGNTVVAPTYGNGAYGIGLVHQF
jgi:hypothetical protein